MVKKKTNNKKPAKLEDESKIFALLAVLLSIIGFIIAILTKKDDKYVMFYAKQSLMLFIVAVVAGIVASVFAIIPILGWLISLAINILILVLWIIALINSASGEKKLTPVIGQYAEDLFNF